MTRIPDANYAGPAFNDTAVVTTQEVNAGKNNPPPGTVAYTIKPGDNLWTISGGNLEGVYQANPQFNPQSGSRNPDLIYPGEVIFVPAEPGSPAATDVAAQALADAQAMPVSTDSQATHKDDRVADAIADLEAAARAEIAAGGDPEAIKARLKEGSELPDSEIDAIVERAKTEPSPTNPNGGPRDNAPLSPEYGSNAAAKAWADANGLPVNGDSQATHKDEQVNTARTAFIDAVRVELEQGADVDEIKARYGNDAALNGLIDQAAAG